MNLETEKFRFASVDGGGSLIINKENGECRFISKEDAEASYGRASEVFFPLADSDAFAEFWRVNGLALAADGINRQRAYDLACNCELIIGGGAAPIFRVGFVDPE